MVCGHCIEWWWAEGHAGENLDRGHGENEISNVTVHGQAAPLAYDVNNWNLLTKTWRQGGSPGWFE